MNILLVYPRYPDTFWSFKHALKFISKRAAYPPLGLLTVASMLPSEWEKKLVDMNTGKLKDKDILWADYVFLSAMGIQQESAREIIARCKQHHIKVIAGGPLFAAGHEQQDCFQGVDCFVLGEAEAVIDRLVEDIERGAVQLSYSSEDRPDMCCSPGPDWRLIDISKYATLSVQYSRGCPYNCDFCDIVLLNGRVPRTKSATQLIGELDAIYRLGWRQAVFIVDDNFIGNKKKLKEEVLPAVVRWMKEKKYPFTFFTQASIGISDDEDLMQLMIEAGFNSVFVGIETPNEDSLSECGKKQNANRDLVNSVKILQHHGFEVQGGFIVGFDSDPQNIFERQINFIQESGIVIAMVGLLNAPPGTALYDRLQKEGRLVGQASGDNTDFSLNFEPKMGKEALINGYKRIISSIYSPRQYYDRVCTQMKECQPVLHKHQGIKVVHIKALLKSVWCLGIKEKGRRYYWRLILGTLVKRPHLFPRAVTLAIYGYNFRTSLSSAFS